MHPQDVVMVREQLLSDDWLAQPPLLWMPRFTFYSQHVGHTRVDLVLPATYFQQVSSCAREQAPLFLKLGQIGK